jgi:hypothetical protein
MENHKDEIIEAYLLGKLSEKEAQAFENQLSQDAELREELAFKKSLQIAVTLQERKRLKAILQEKSRQQPSVEVHSWRYAAAIIGFLLVVSAGLFIYTNKSEDQLFLAYYEPFPNIEAPTVRGTLDFNGLTEAFLAYDNEEYELAQLLFSDHFKENQDFVSAFYAAMASIEIGEFHTALEFITHAGDSPEVYEIPKLWYTALIHLKLEKRSDALDLLKVIAESEHPLSANASRLKRQLD